MHNLHANFINFLDICKRFAEGLVDKNGNVRRRGVVPRFSDLEVVALGMSAEHCGIDSECLLFKRLGEYSDKFPNLISRRQFNDRRKKTAGLDDKIRRRIAEEIDSGETCFCIDSKPLPVCETARRNRCRMSRFDEENAPATGYCASKRMYYFGYKMHIVCGLGGVIHSFNLTKANVHDIGHLRLARHEFKDCTIVGDKGYISEEIQTSLFETARVRLEVPRRRNQKFQRPVFASYSRARKRVETVFSQLKDHLMVERNYAKHTKGYFARILSKIATFTALQYVNFIHGRPVGQVKYAGIIPLTGIFY